MKCELNNSFLPRVNYHTIPFKSKEVDVDWKSESGQAIFDSLAYLASVSQVNLINHKDKKEQKSIEDFVTDFEKSYKETNDTAIVNKHYQLLKDAFKNIDLLKGSISNLNKNDIFETILSKETIDTLGIVGKGTLESAFAYDLLGFNSFCKITSNLKNVVSEENIENLKRKINPENTEEYRDLEQEVLKDKKLINVLLGDENLEKRNELVSQIKILKNDKANNVEVKKLKKEVQNLYKNCENSNEIEELMNSINKKQGKMKEILSQKVNLSPQDIVKKSLGYCVSRKKSIFGF